MRALFNGFRRSFIPAVFERPTVIGARRIFMISTVSMALGLTQSSDRAVATTGTASDTQIALATGFSPDAAATQAPPQPPLNPALGSGFGPATPPKMPASMPDALTDAPSEAATETGADAAQPVSPPPAPDTAPDSAANPAPAPVDQAQNPPLNPALGSGGGGDATPPAAPDAPSAPDPTPNPDPATPAARDPDGNVIASNTTEAPDPGPVSSTPGSSGPVSSPDPKPDLTLPPGTTTITGGRVSILTPQNAEQIAQIEILTKPEHGNVTVNPNGTLAVVMTDSDFFGQQSFQYRATYQDGQSDVIDQTLLVSPSPQALGWGSGDHYMLRTDENDAVIVEHGDNHRKVYVSGNPQALGLRDIAALEGLDVNEITPGWLSRHEEYGATPEMALDQQAGGILWQMITNNWDAGPVSNWLLLERGYRYDESMGPVLHPSQKSESELHPVLITAYGEGAKPILNNTIYAGGQTKTQNFVVKDIEMGGSIRLFEAQNVLFENITSQGNGFGVQRSEGVTLRYSDFTDVIKDTPNPNSPDFWAAHLNRTTATYISDTKDILLENNFYDHTGWADDFRSDGDTSGGQPPSMFSHNLYLQYNTSNVTFRDNITMRGASFGAQFRGGAYIEDNVFLDNNAAVNFLGGNYLDFGHFANYSLFADNLVTSGAHRIGPEMVGGLTLGVNDTGLLSTLKDNIVAHLADPANPAEQAEKHVTHYAVGTESLPYYNDTIVYNWGSGGGGGTLESAANANIQGKNPAVLDQTTIQTYAAKLLGQPKASIADLADHLRDHGHAPRAGLSDAELIVRYFQDGFDLDYAGATAPAAMRFVPNPLAEGTRWDNRLNWQVDQIPQDGSDVDLAGNWVQYGGTATLSHLDLGRGGQLAVSNGYLEVTGALNNAGDDSAIHLSRAGQLVLNSFLDSDTLELNVNGGRFANAGQIAGQITLTSSGGQSLLALGGAQFDLTAGSHLTISGSDASVGFDGTGGAAALLRLHPGATLEYVADLGGFSTLQEFRSGMFDQDGTHAQSGVDLGGAALALDVAALGDIGTSGHLLMAADEIIGQFSTITLRGLGPHQDAMLTLDYGADVIILDLTENGAGSGALSLTIAQDDGRDIASGALRDALGGDLAPPSQAPNLFVEDEQMPIDHIFFM